MAKLTVKSTIQLELTITLTEIEARVLDALAGYGADAFIKHFYEHLGKADMEEHEKGVNIVDSPVYQVKHIFQACTPVNTT